jgi:hypothetical protein
VLAHYAGVPERFQIEGRVWNAAQIVDVYSARKARASFTRRGVWVQTVEAFFDAFGRSGRSPLLFGFPSPRPSPAPCGPGPPGRRARDARRAVA